MLREALVLPKCEWGSWPAHLPWHLPVRRPSLLSRTKASLCCSEKFCLDSELNPSSGRFRILDLVENISINQRGEVTRHRGTFET